MALDRQTIESHRKNLVIQKADILAQLNATAGAIETCDYLLSLNDKAENSLKAQQ